MNFWVSMIITRRALKVYFTVAWLTHSALKLAKAVADLDVYIEQPCRSYAECRTVRAHTNLPFVLVSDEWSPLCKGLIRFLRQK